jgi:5-methyltetrahydropteroyltriglutamate--homocysteine methyltransferase
MHVDHVGSLLRPESLKAAFLEYGAGRLAADELRLAQDDAIRSVVAKQEALGLPVATDGEYRRLNWQVSFSEVEGWDLWGGSWKSYLQNPENRAPHEQPLTKGDDAVVSFRAPATARLALKKSFPL